MADANANTLVHCSAVNESDVWSPEMMRSRIKQLQQKLAHCEGRFEVVRTRCAVADTVLSELKRLPAPAPASCLGLASYTMETGRMWSEVGILRAEIGADCEEIDAQEEKRLARLEALEAQLKNAGDLASALLKLGGCADTTMPSSCAADGDLK
jgi:hypothetical protein